MGDVEGGVTCYDELLGYAPIFFLVHLLSFNYKVGPKHEPEDDGEDATRHSLISTLSLIVQVDRLPIQILASKEIFHPLQRANDGIFRRFRLFGYGLVEARIGVNIVCLSKVNASSCYVVVHFLNLFLI